MKQRFGAHLSVAGGLHLAIDSATIATCDCLQIFVKNQRQWAAPPITDEQIILFFKAKNAAGIRPIVAHASYLLNLASPDRHARTKSVRALLDEHQRCEMLGLDALIFHPGAHMDDAMAAGIRRIATSLDQVSTSLRGSTCRILLETTAGQGSAVGYRFEQIGDILGRVKSPDDYGICLDTCHLFAAGYDFRKPDGYAAMIDELDASIGVANVHCIHMNDSKRELGSRVDRHEHIGKGCIGKQGFANFVNDKRFSGVPMILETPKGKDGRGTDLDKVNLKRLRALVLA